MKSLAVIMLSLVASNALADLAPLAERKATLAACRSKVEALETKLGKKHIKMRSNKQCASKLQSLSKK